MRRVTARHVLTHTSGLPNWRHVPGPLVPATEPGETYAYSGEGFFYLQRVVERVTGRPIARLLREEVLQPLGMTREQLGVARRLRCPHGRRVRRERKPGRGLRGDRAAHAVIARGVAQADRGVALRGCRAGGPAGEPGLAGAAGIHGAERGRVPAHDRARLRPLPGARRARRAPRRRSALARPATREAMMTPAGPDQQRAGLGTRLGDAGGRVRPDALALGRQQRLPQLRPWPIPPTAAAVVVLTNSGNGPRVYERVIVALTGHDHPAFLRA